MTVPFGSVDTVIVSGAPAGLIVRLTGPEVVCCVVLESVAFTVRATVPAVVGVPATMQPALVSVRPAGNVPAVMVQAYGAVPPVTPMVAVYGTFTVPFGKEVTVILSGIGAAAMMTVSVPVVVCTGLLVSVAFTWKLKVFAVVGVPLRTHPVSVRPPGSVPPVMVQE